MAGRGLLERAREAVETAGQVRQGLEQAGAAIRQGLEDWEGAAAEARAAADGAREVGLEWKTRVQAAGDAVHTVREGLDRASSEAVRQFGGEWKALVSDLGEAGKELGGQLLDQAREEVVSSLRAQLAAALSEGNIRKASQVWRRLAAAATAWDGAWGDGGGGGGGGEGGLWGLLVPRLREEFEGPVRRYFESLVSECGTRTVMGALDATSDLTLHLRGLRKNAHKTNAELFQEMTECLCTLQGAVAGLHRHLAPYLPAVGLGDYAPYLEQAVRLQSLPRVTLAVAAGTIHGIPPQDHPFLATLIVTHALGQLSQEAAENLVLFLGGMVAGAGARGSKGGAATVQGLVSELMGGARTCQQLGSTTFDFFEVVAGTLAALGAEGGVHATATATAVADTWAGLGEHVSASPASAVFPSGGDHEALAYESPPGAEASCAFAMTSEEERCRTAEEASAPRPESAAAAAAKASTSAKTVATTSAEELQRQTEKNCAHEEGTPGLDSVRTPPPPPPPATATSRSTATPPWPLPGSPSPPPLLSGSGPQPGPLPHAQSGPKPTTPAQALPHRLGWKGGALQCALWVAWAADRPAVAGVPGVLALTMAAAAVVVVVVLVLVLAMRRRRWRWRWRRLWRGPRAHHA